MKRRSDAGNGAGITFLRANYLDPSAHGSWPYHIAKNGYAHVYLNGRPWGAHVIACELAYGPKPTPELEAAHSCRLRSCFYAEHLRWDTCWGNLADRWTDGTIARGERQGNAKLTERVVREVHDRYWAGTPSEAFKRELAAEYGISFSNVESLVYELSWKHLWVGEPA